MENRRDPTGAALNLCDTVLQKFRSNLDEMNDPIDAYLTAIQNLYYLQMDLLNAVKESGLVKNDRYINDMAGVALAHITCAEGRGQTSFDDHLARLVFETTPIGGCIAILLRTGLRNEAITKLASEEPTKDLIGALTHMPSMMRPPFYKVIQDTMHAEPDHKRKVWQDGLLALTE